MRAYALRKHSVLTPCLTPVNVALSFLIPGSPARASPTEPRLLFAISLLVFTGVVFRSEVALLLAPIAIHAMIFVVPPVRLIKTGTISAALSIGKGGERSNIYTVFDGKTRTYGPCGLLFLGPISPLAGTLCGLL